MMNLTAAGRHSCDVRLLPQPMEAATSTFALLEKARSGDDEALSKVFEQYRRRLIVLVYFKLSPQSREGVVAEDVVQEVCLRAFRDLDRFTYRTPGSFLRWLSAIADHVIADLARYRNRDCRAGEEVPFRSESNPLGPDPADSRTPSRLLREQEAVDRLLAQLSRLPEDYRQAILLARIEGLSTAEAAERMGKSREQVALLVYRAVKRLRELCVSGIA
jgi:RNA polymerase sigma-70 factor (ECF subfamily)